MFFKVVAKAIKTWNWLKDLGDIFNEHFVELGKAWVDVLIFGLLVVVVFERLCKLYSGLATKFVVVSTSFLTESA